MASGKMTSSMSQRTRASSVLLFRDQRKVRLSMPYMPSKYVSPLFHLKKNGIQVIVLASFNSGPNWLTGVVEQYSCARKPRPIGHLKILNASKGKVWVIDTHERPFIIDVNYPGAPNVYPCNHHLWQDFLLWYMEWTINM